MVFCLSRTIDPKSVLKMRTQVSHPTSIYHQDVSYNLKQTRCSFLVTKKHMNQWMKSVLRSNLISIQVQISSAHWTHWSSTTWSFYFGELQKDVTLWRTMCVVLLRNVWSVELECVTGLWWYCSPEGTRPAMCWWSQSLNDLISFIIALIGFKLLLKRWKIEWINNILS